MPCRSPWKQCGEVRHDLPREGRMAGSRYHRPIDVRVAVFLREIQRSFPLVTYRSDVGILISLKRMYRQMPSLASSGDRADPPTAEVGVPATVSIV